MSFESSFVRSAASLSRSEIEFVDTLISEVLESPIVKVFS